MAFLYIYIMRKHQGKFLIVRPALPVFRWFPGVEVYRPDVAIPFELVANNLAAEEYL
jgi:hypothetical protein